MKPTTDSRLPVHVKVRDELMRRVNDRVWRGGEALPGEEKLAIEFGISVGTMRKVIQAMVQDGVLERVHGKGTFVTRAFERTSMLRFVRFTDPGSKDVPEARILKLVVEPASDDVAQRLHIKAGAKTIYVHRARSHGNEVVLVEHIWLAHSRFSKLVPVLQKSSPPLLYPVYDTVCGVLVSRAVDELEMARMSAPDAAVFGVDAGSACMRIRRQMHDHSGDVVESRVSFVPADKFHYTVEIR